MLLTREEIKPFLPAQDFYGVFWSIEMIVRQGCDIGKSEVIADAARMVEKMPYSDGLFVLGQFRDVFTCIIIKRDFTLQGKNSDA